MTRSPTEIVKDEKVYAIMGNSENSSSQNEYFKQIHRTISTKLAKEREQFPAYFPKAIHVLLPVDAYIEGQLQERLQQAKQCYNRENIVLIPYHVQNLHWIGVILRFNVSTQLDRAEFIDPVVNSNFSPTKLEMEFSKTFPGVVLEPVTLQKHPDPKYSEELMIRNLLDAVKETHSTNPGWTNEKRHVSISAVPQSNVLEHTYGQNCLNSELTNRISQSRSDAAGTVSSIIPTAYSDKNLNTIDDANTYQRNCGQLAEVENVTEHSQSREPDASIEFENRLATNDISNETELLKQITARKELIQSPEREGRYNIRLTTKAPLSELKQSQLLTELVNATTPSHTNVYYEEVIDHANVVDIINNRSEAVESSVRSEISRKQDEECLNTEERLIDLWNDSNQLPPCSEKYIIRLLFYVSIKLSDKENILRPNVNIPNEIEEEIMKEFYNMIERLEIEELQSEQVQDIIETCGVCLRNKNWNNVLTDLRKLLKEVRPLDIQELIRLVAKVDDAAKLIKGKEIILFLGGTGAGKSTIIHFLGGSKMAETMVQGIYHIAPIEIRNPNLRKITTAPFARSETRYISPVTINFQDIGGSRRDSSIICDSPGFEDTNGPEVDIANAIGIVKAIRGCKSVKPVVLISYRSIGDRCGGVKDLAHMLAGLIPGIQDYMSVISYLFTKFPANERSTINALLRNVEDELTPEEKSDTSFNIFLRDMILKTRKKSRAIDPVNDEPLDILQELVRPDTTIAHPEEVFRFSITEKSKSIVRDQVRKHQISIISATKRSDYLFLQYKLDQLKHLNNLLHQDDIEQIYKDSVAFINKHLKEEYEIGISDLDRCLMNQNVLTVKDMERYQIYMKHSQDAEELKSKHLSRDVVHSSAFTQYLNQVVDTLYADLKDRDIDDPLVKTSLDKIKLLSTVFPNVSITYNKINQLLVEKVKLVVESFETSVQSTQFNNSASNMTKLRESLNILDGHVDREELEKAYNNLKKNLLNYLNASTVKFNDIFTKQLDKSDIDSLNSCICILESALNTFALHSHISKEELNTISENLSLKIMNYFKAIVEKIEQTAELSNLEPLMAELDSIRTISTFDIKTSQLYFSTLEKLIKYVNQYRQNVEQLLFSLFRKEQINFDKLSSCLINLKDAKWIEKYRTGVHSDVIDTIEKQIIELIKELKKSALQTNLDLDHSNKIKGAHEIVLYINEMKRLNKFVPSIDKHIDEVNQWFIKVIHDVFDIIKNIFNVEKWKEQNYKTLDFSKAEKGLNYLSICKEIPDLFQSDCKSTLNSLEEFMKYFSSFIQNEMDSNFEKIEKYEGQNADEISENAKIIASRLLEISEIETKYRYVSSYFLTKDLVQQWKKKLSEYLNELLRLMDLISRTKQVDALNTKLSIAKALSKLDSFMEDKKFFDAYKEYQNILLKIRDANDTSAPDMTVFKISNIIDEQFFQQAGEAINAINVGLDTLLEDTKHKTIMLGHGLEKGEINSIVENLRRMQKAKQLVSQFLEKADHINKCSDEVKTLLAKPLNSSIDNIRVLISSNNFYEADKKIDSITLVRNLLGSYCTEDIAKQIDELKTDQNNTVLTDVVRKYSDMDISEYTLEPPTDTLYQLGSVINTNPIYSRAYNEIKRAIFTKFRKELAEAKSMIPSTNDNIHIRKFESAVKHLPGDMKRILEEELKHCKEDIDRSIHDNDNKLNDTCSNGNLNSIKSLLEEYKNCNGMGNYFNRGRELLLARIPSIVIKITKCFEEHDLVEAFLNVRILHDYRVKFLDLIPDIRKPCSDVQNQIKAVFFEAYNNFFNTFLDSTLSMVTNDRVQAVEKSFIDLIEFMKFSSENKNENNGPLLIDMLPGDFNEKIQTLNQRLVEYLIERKKVYKEALEKLDVTSLTDILDTSQQWNLLFIKIRDHYTIYHTIDDSANAVVKTIKTFALFSKIVESIPPRIKELINELIRQELINDLTKGFSKHRDEFYSKLNEKYTILSNTTQFSTYKINFDVVKAEQKCLKSLETKIVEISSNAEILLNRFIKDEKLDRQEYDSFNLYYNNMISFKNEMKIIKFEINHKTENLENKFFEKVRQWKAQIESERRIDCVADILILMKRTENNFPSFKIKIYDTIDAILNQLKNSRREKTAFGKLGIVLNRDITGIGQSIVAEHKAFQGYSLSLFNEKIQKHGIEYVLEHISGELLDKEKLKKRYDEFRAIYDSLVKQYLKPEMILDQLIADIKLLAGYVKHDPDHIKWDFTIRNKVPKLAAHIFALWTLQNANYYFEATEVNNRNSYLLQPHAAQVISIFRMLGIGDSEEKLSNNLVQIGTGEGKSITLGATASILALLGFDVSCACYSEYLSQRDYTAFRSLFDSLGVLNHIHYGTFNKLCEYIINENGDIRQVVERLVSKNSNLAVENAKIIKRQKILLIDEVDVFFSRDFYGNVYTPATGLKDNTVTCLINYIWRQRESRLTLNRVKKTQEYQNCCTRFPNWELLIQEAVKDMISDVKSFESHNYVVKEDKIGYIELDNILYNVVYGYKTLFAYYFEYEKGKISKKSLEDNICIRIKCGSFSYAETPLKFSYIIGVTGTLITLSELEKETIENVYRVNKTTITPSVFGDNNLQFIKRNDIRIENSYDYLNVIKREIDDRLIGKSSGNRAVMVFFESEKKLKAFYESKALESIKDSVVYLTEEASLTEKENLIKRATESGQVTLFTKVFGRGTDFICHDPSVASNSGIHVIQTFLSEEISEEVQIRGRTARQGDYGSYSMILLDDDLEKFQIEKGDIQDVRDDRGSLAAKYNSMYDFLNDKRITFFKFQYEANAKYVKQAKIRHELSQEFLSKLKSGEIDSIRKFLINENKGAEGISSSRTICLMDATGSMSQLLQKSKNTVGIMFERATTILKTADINSDLFEVQFVVYRNYNSQEEKILQHSPWETKPDNLRAFMNTINAEGGWDNEAIEIGLWHANKEHERENITQVILIGDAPPNTRADINFKRHKEHGKDYWEKTKFAKVTYYGDELAILTSNNIPVHTFFVAGRAENSFREIARRTGGRSEFLDVNSSFGSDMLTALVTKQILRNIGGTARGDALVSAYERTFGTPHA